MFRAGVFFLYYYVYMVKKLYPLCENHLFSKAYRKGRCEANKYVAVYVLKNYEKHPARAEALTRLGITVNKKLGKAVRRSRVKRMIRAAYRAYLPKLKNGYLIIIAARTAAFEPKVKSTDIAEKLCVSLQKLGVTVDAPNMPKSGSDRATVKQPSSAPRRESRGGDLGKAGSRA